MGDEFCAAGAGGTHIGATVAVVTDWGAIEIITGDPAEMVGVSDPVPSPSSDLSGDKSNQEIKEEVITGGSP